MRKRRVIKRCCEEREVREELKCGKRDGKEREERECACIFDV